MLITYLLKRNEKNQLVVFLNHAIPIIATVKAATAAEGLMLCRLV